MTEPLPRLEKKEAWATRLGVILAVTGSAVGLGNFLRFPGVAINNGGGAFMIPYFVSFLVLGLPIAWVEWALGRYGGARGFNSAPGIFRAIWPSRAAPFAGVLALLIPVAIYMYYVFIEAWCLGYAWKYATGGMAAAKDDPSAYFLGFVGADADGQAFSDILGGVLPFLAICFVINFFLIYRGVTRGIELFCKIAMPALVVIALIILVRVLTLGTPDPALPERSVDAGLGFMWNPTSPERGFWDVLTSGQAWMDAAGQIFFSLSVGFGIVLTYASYMRKNDDVALSATTAAAGNGFCEVALGGLITIPAVVIFLGVETAKAKAGSTLGMGFMALPGVFEHMPAGYFFGFLFFFLLFLAAVTSSLSMLQPAIALLEEGLGLGRRASVALLGFITAMGTGIIVWFSAGLTVLDTVDFWVGTFCIYILALVQVVMFGWILGIDKGMTELERGAEMRIPSLVKYVIKYVSPLYLLIVFGVWVYQQVTTEGPGNRFTQIAQNTPVQLALLFIGLLVVLFALLVGASVKRWNRLERERAGEATA